MQPQSKMSMNRLILILVVALTCLAWTQSEAISINIWKHRYPFQGGYGFYPYGGYGGGGYGGISLGGGYGRK